MRINDVIKIQAICNRTKFVTNHDTMQTLKVMSLRAFVLGS